jgi:ATP-dependent Lon protease
MTRKSVSTTLRKSARAGTQRTSTPVRSVREYSDLLECNVPDELPVLPLLSTVVFPNGVYSVQVAQDRNKTLIKENSSDDQMVALVAQRESREHVAKLDDLYGIGVAARVIQKINMPNDTIQVVFHGLRRIVLLDLLQTEPYLRARLTCAFTQYTAPLVINNLMGQVLSLFKDLVNKDSRYPNELINILEMNVEDPERFADLITTHVNFSMTQRQTILETLNMQQRLNLLIDMLAAEIGRVEVDEEIQRKTQVDIEKSQHEFFLRQQLQTIRKELGEQDPMEAEVAELRKRMEAIPLSEAARKEVENEIYRLGQVASASPEYNVIKTYLEWILGLPWGQLTRDEIDIRKAQQILDEDHYGLAKVKERIVEFLSVLKLKKDLHGPILCLSGPPGVGKTSLGKSIARAMGRKFIRISVGGMRDEAEIKGHRRTYVGAMPGKIIQSLRRAGVMNPLIMIDEVDKMGYDFRGDPSSALLEVLDPEQNRYFEDHYLDVPVDLSHVLFITTANVIQNVPAPLRDRMEVLALSGYTAEEKLQIAVSYLVPRRLEANGLQRSHLCFEETAIQAIISGYTREAGLRNLERALDAVCRKVAAKVAAGACDGVCVTPEMLEEFLGPVQYIQDVADKKPEIGVALGLAWTPDGGDILSIESTQMRGKGNVTITGQLGSVMQESVRAAMSYVRSRCADLEIDPEAFDRCDIHIHFPEGAIPKDGPSAGITVATALASLLTDRPVWHNIAMTGELTLRGKVLPVGGIKEKVLAAYRAGVEKVILPAQNRKDLVDVPAEVVKKIEFIFVEAVDEVLQQALATIILPRSEERRKKRVAAPVGEDRRGKDDRSSTSEKN